MSRLLAIDYGLKRVGIAVTDTLQIIASPLTTVPNKELKSFLSNYIEKEGVEKVIIGLPKNLKNEDTHATQPVLKFIDQFKKRFPNIPIITIDERFTSKMAFQSLIDSGASKKTRRKKENIDQISASIILQDYMVSNKL